jgi:hypothetical protein
MVMPARTSGLMGNEVAAVQKAATRAWLFGFCRRNRWLVVATLSAAIAFVIAVHLTHGTPVSAATTSALLPGHQPLLRKGIASAMHDEPARQLFADANLDELCSRIAAQAAHESRLGEAPITAAEPANAEQQRLAGVCAKRLTSSDDNILSRVRDAANAGNTEAKRQMLEQKLQQDAEDVDAMGDDLLPDDMSAVYAYYADHVAALREMALQPDIQAANLMADLIQNGKLVERDPIAAAAWQLFARMSVQGTLPSDEDLLRDPALEELDEADSNAAIAQAKTLYSHMHSGHP